MKEVNQIKTEAVIDGVLQFLVAGGFLTSALAAPNSVQIFDKPLNNWFKKMDERAQKRELRRVIHYMKARGLVSYQTRDYEHGIKLTKAGIKRLEKSNYDQLQIAQPHSWDKKWRIVFFDIPENLKGSRDTLTRKLKHLGFRQLQKSIWIHPFPCRPEIEAVCQAIGIRKFVTLVEISHIDNEAQLRERFTYNLK